MKEINYDFKIYPCKTSGTTLKKTHPKDMPLETNYTILGLPATPFKELILSKLIHKIQIILPHIT